MSDKACHTCRRRRVKCDRSLPHCQRCRGEGKECLGYGKLILWNQGVASRGKMMGKNFAPAKLPSSHQVKPQNTTHDFQPAHGNLSDFFTRGASNGNFSILHAPLIDPIFQDLNPSSKRFLSHYGRTFCKEMVVYDVPDQNPVRQLLKYARDHPVLLNAILAVSANHLYYLLPPETRQISIYNEALAAKQRAIQFLKDALSNIGNFDVNIMLAAVILLIWLDFIECGKGTWRIHLEGAKGLISHVKDHAGTQSVVSAAENSVRRWLISEFLVLDIVGSTFSSTRSLETSIYGIEDDFDLDSILMTNEVNSYVSCPAKLLRHILAIAQMPEDSHLDPAQQSSKNEQAVMILHSTEQFDPSEWASVIQSFSPCHDLNERRWVASAYKAATCLYVSRMLPSDHPANYTTQRRQEMVSTVVDQLSHLHPENGLFKSTSWPCFIAGAEANDPGQRVWVMSHLKQIYSVLPYKTYPSSMEALEMLWQNKYTNSALECYDTEDWIRTVRKLSVDLFIA